MTEDLSYKKVKMNGLTFFVSDEKTAVYLPENFAMLDTLYRIVAVVFSDLVPYDKIVVGNYDGHLSLKHLSLKIETILACAGKEDILTFRCKPIVTLAQIRDYKQSIFPQKSVYAIFVYISETGDTVWLSTNAEFSTKN